MAAASREKLVRRPVTIELLIFQRQNQSPIDIYDFLVTRFAPESFLLKILLFGMQGFCTAVQALHCGSGTCPIIVTLRVSIMHPKVGTGDVSFTTDPVGVPAVGSL
jgi:hypothetical protein